MTPSYASNEQILAQIRAGKSLGWLSINSGLAPSDVETLARSAGYVFGANGVPRLDADQAALVERDVLDDQADLQIDSELEHVFAAVDALDALELDRLDLLALDRLAERVAEIRRRHAGRIQRLEALTAAETAGR